ncbi:MAG: hypothetical protein A2156_04575 [Deltaproteobacteria bacterium RBG_16_48_10]|nr:MAG: hypothetical protein A2156_04575 [Deltaproteobacteria bacterium RBG_16_48_10]
MKKLFVLSLLILAFAATAYSQPKLDFRASGFISMTTYVDQWNLSNQVSGRPGIVNVVTANQKPGGAEFNKTMSYVESRARLKFDAIMGKELTGTIFFEADSATWGDTSASFGSVSKNRYGVWGGDRPDLEVKNIYVDAAVPYIPVPITFRAGLQPYGVRSNMFMYTDGTGITAAAKVDPFTIIGMWAKALEGRLANSDDVDIYGGHINAKVDTLTLGGYGMYFRMRTYPLSAVTATTPYGFSADLSSNMWWLGAYADGKLGPLMLNFDFVYDTGDVKSKSGLPKVKYSGWASRLKLDFPWEAFNFGVVGHYGSGADLRKTDQFGVPGAAVSDPVYAGAGAVSTRVSSYVVPPGSETGSFSESEVFFASYVGGGFSGFGYTGDGGRMSRGSAGGVWLAKLYGSYKVAPEFKVTLQGLYIGDTAAGGNTFGTSRNASGSLSNDSTIGWEFDMINEWQVYKNLSFKFGGGILFPGNALKFWNSTLDTNEKPDKPWAVITNMTYSF